MFKTKQTELLRVVEILHTTRRREFLTAADYDARWAAALNMQLEIYKLELCLDELRESLREERMIDKGRDLSR